MTEYNLFCYSESFNDGDSFQQERYRVFNKTVGEKRYNEILKLVTHILPTQGTLWLDVYWKSVSSEQWSKILEIPEAKGFERGLEFITDCKIEPVIPNLSGKEVKVELDGRTYIAVIK